MTISSIRRKKDPDNKWAKARAKRRSSNLTRLIKRRDARKGKSIRFDLEAKIPAQVPSLDASQV